MAKKNKKIKKKSKRIEKIDSTQIENLTKSDVVEANEANEENTTSEKENSITKRLEKIKSINVFEGLNPLEHVDELKEQVLSTAQQVEKIEEEKQKGFPWIEFLIGFSLGGILLIVMFVFHINFAKNVDERINNLENRLAMWNPMIGSSGHEDMEIASRQTMFESELNSLKNKLRQLKLDSITDHGSFTWNTDEFTTKEIIFSNKFSLPPAIFCQCYPQDLLFSISIKENNNGFTCTLTNDNNNTKGIYKLYWLAIGKHP